MVKYQDGIMKFKYNQPPTSVLRYGGLSAYFETLLFNQSLGIFSNFGAKNPPHRKAEKRQVVKKPQTTFQTTVNCAHLNGQ